MKTGINEFAKLETPVQGRSGENVDPQLVTTRAYFSKGLINSEGSRVEAAAVMDVLTLMAGRELEIRVKSEHAVYGAWKEARRARFPTLAAGTGSGQGSTIW